MNDRPIQPGDLVYVYRDCCGHYIGIHFVVTKITFDFGACGYCPILLPAMIMMAFPEPSSELNLIPVAWLKRVPPLADLKGESIRVPVRVPEEVV